MLAAAMLGLLGTSVTAAADESANETVARRFYTELTHRAAAAIPNARVRVLNGHGQFAYKTDPALVADVIRNWVMS